MRKSIRRAAVLGSALVALVAGAIPSQAASVGWEDPKDDAVQSPLPNDPAFDITTVSLSNDGGNFTWETTVPELAAGRPTISTGYSFRMLFTHGDVAFRFQVAENLLGEQTFSVSLASGTLPPPPLECEKCEGKIDREAKKVIVTAPLASLDKALQSAEAPALAGQEWSGLSVVAYRPVGVPNPGGVLPATGVVFVVDTAASPEGTTLAF